MSRQKLFYKLSAVMVFSCLLNACGEEAVAPKSQDSKDSPVVQSAQPMGLALPKTDPDNVVEVSEAQPAEVNAPLRRGEIDYPDDETMTWIYYHWANIEPPIRELAKEIVNKKSTYNTKINEFNRDDFILSEASAIQQRFNEAKDIGVINLNIRGSLSDYDTTYGEFYVGAFTPGAYFSFAGMGGIKVQLKLVNSQDANIWKVSPADAKEITNRFDSSFRGVTAITTIKLVKAKATAAGGVLEGKIISYVLSTNEGVRLGQVALPN